MGVERVTRRTLLAGAVATAALRSSSAAARASSHMTGSATVTASSRRMAPPVQRLPGWTVGTIGESVEGRPIERIDTRPERPGRHVVVICGMHGNERAAADLADGFGRINRPDDLHLTLVPLLNPDGWAAGTRNNGRNVDLNRNFSWGWPRRPDSGTGPASEPETKEPCCSSRPRARTSWCGFTNR